MAENMVMTHDEIMAEAYCADESQRRQVEIGEFCSEVGATADGDTPMDFDTAEVVLMKPDGRHGPGIPLEGGLERVRFIGSSFSG